MSNLATLSDVELVWAKRLAGERAWSFCSAKNNFIAYASDEQLSGVNYDGELLMAKISKNKLIGRPVIIRGTHCENTVLNHFNWVPSGLEHVQRVLWDMLNFIEIPSLRQFYYSVLTNDVLMEKFYRAKASNNHHHNYNGGLLEHSYEVASSAAAMSQQYQLDHASVCIAFIAGLLHDIGKVKMYYNDPSNRGVCGQHEAFNFMELAEPLSVLHKTAPNLFEAISGPLTAKIGHHQPQYLPETIIRQCDRLSAEIAQCRKAFAGMPDYYWYVKSESDNRVFKRLSAM